MRKLAVAPFLAALALPACMDPDPPIWVVPSDHPRAAADMTGRAARALSELGWSVVRVDPVLGLVATDWEYGPQVKGTTRRRALIRVPADADDAVAVSVPLEFYDGEDWCPNGEDEDRRKYLVATLRARLAAARTP